MKTNITLLSTKLKIEMQKYLESILEKDIIYFASLKEHKIIYSCIDIDAENRLLEVIKKSKIINNIQINHLEDVTSITFKTSLPTPQPPASQTSQPGPAWSDWVRMGR